MRICCLIESYADVGIFLKRIFAGFFLPYYYLPTSCFSGRFCAPRLNPFDCSSAALSPPWLSVDKNQSGATTLRKEQLTAGSEFHRPGRIPAEKKNRWEYRGK